MHVERGPRRASSAKYRLPGWRGVVGTTALRSPPDGPLDSQVALILGSDDFTDLQRQAERFCIYLGSSRARQDALVVVACRLDRSPPFPSSLPSFELLIIVM